MNRRAFLKLLAVLPAALGLAQLPLAVAEALPEVDPPLPPLPPLVGPTVAGSYRQHITIEIDGVPIGVRDLTVTQEVDRIDVSNTGWDDSLEIRPLRQYVYGLRHDSVQFTSEDPAALTLYEKQDLGKEVDVRIIFAVPELTIREYVVKARGFLTQISMDAAPPTELLRWTVGLKLFELVAA